MGHAEQDIFAPIEDAVAAWNTRAGQTWPEMAEAIEAIREELEIVAGALERRKTLSSELVMARVKLEALDQRPEEREAAVDEIIRQFEALDNAFTAFEESLPLLRGQAQRAAHKAQDLLACLTALQPRSEEELTPPPSDASRLSTQLRALRETLSELRGQLDTDAATPVQEDAAPPEVITETIPPPHDESAARFERLQRHASDAVGNARPLGQILVDAGVITAEQLESALMEQDSAWHRHLGAILVTLGYTNEEAIAQTLAAQTRRAYFDLRPGDVQPEAAHLMPGRLATRHTCIPVRVEGGTLTVAMANPLDLIAQEDLRLATHRHIEPVVASARRIRAAIQRHYYGKR